MSVEGQLSDMSLASLIQMTSAEMRRSALHVWDGPRQGVIYLEEGTVVHAATDATVGVEAFYELLGWREGRFRLENQVPAPARTIGADVAGLLIEGLQHLDEERDRPGGNGHLLPLKTWSEDLAEALSSVRATGQDLEGLLVVDCYGRVISASLPLGSLDRIRVSMLAPELWRACQCGAQKMGRPLFSELIFRGEAGNVLVVCLGGNAMLVALAKAEANLAELFPRAREAAERATDILARIPWLWVDPLTVSETGASLNGHRSGP